MEILNPALEGQVDRIGFEQSYQLGYRRGGRVRLVLARATYESQPVPEADPQKKEPAFKIVTAAMPKQMFPRGLLAPSMIAHVLVQKYRWGLPFHRQSRMLAAEGCKLDDSVMCRYAEDAGATLGCIVDASAKEAREQAFCLSTDATGVCIQPDPLAGRQRQACRKGHFFVVLADKDHVFFEYQPRHTSAAVCEMFRGFSGYIQADAHAIYDAIFRGDARSKDDDTPPKEVGCWSHARRKAWEAAVVAKNPAAREALLRMRALFQLEEQWADLAPAQRHARRQLASRPLVDDFFAWAAVQYARVKDTRGLVATAFGYAVRQQAALRRFLDDGRLPMTNNHLRASAQGDRRRPARMDVLRLGRSRQRRRQPLLAHRLVRAARHRSRGLSARRHPRAPVLAARPLPGARAEVLGRDPSANPREGTRRRDRRHHGSAPAAPAGAAGFALIERPRTRACVTTSGPSRTGSVQRVR